MNEHTHWGQIAGLVSYILKRWKNTHAGGRLAQALRRETQKGINHANDNGNEGLGIL
jgi:hypothetical protein